MSRCWIFQCRCSWRSLLRASRCHCQTTRRYSPHSWSNQSHRQGDPVVLRTNHGISTRPWCGAERGRAKACPAARAETGRAGPGPDATKLLASRHQNLKETPLGHQTGVKTPEWKHPQQWTPEWKHPLESQQSGDPWDRTSFQPKELLRQSSSLFTVVEL